MPQGSTLATSIFITVGGRRLPDTVKNSVQEVVVDQSVSLPDMFTIRITDNPDVVTKKFNIVDGDVFDLGDEVKITAHTEDGTRHELIKGEITALEPNFTGSMTANMLIRGYDKSHRLHRRKQTRTFLGHKDSDVANKIAGEAGLSPQVDETGLVYDYIIQRNQTNMEFLQQRARRIGFEAFAQEGKLYFRKPQKPSGSPAITVEFGRDLRAFQPRMTVSHQVGKVTVKGWDAKAKKAIVGQAVSEEIKAEMKAEAARITKGGAFARAPSREVLLSRAESKFGTSEFVLVDEPVVSQDEANRLAQGLIDELSSDSILAEGLAEDLPQMKAGQVIEIKGVGERFSGNYYLTSVMHVWSTGGLEQNFQITSRLPNRMAGLSETEGQETIDRRIGVVPALVTNTQDPDQWGRVKLQYPWLGDVESDWARIVSVGAGAKGSGFFAVPEVGDEVMVAFEHGDFHRPYVLGGLWNGKDAIPGGGKNAQRNEKPKVRTWTSRTGHYITMHDDAADKIEIKTKDGQLFLLDNKNKTIQMKSEGDILIEAKGKITVKSKQDMALQTNANMTSKATGDMKLDVTKNLTAEAKLNTTVKGLQLGLEGKTKSELKGLTVSVNGSTLTEVKGALVKIN